MARTHQDDFSILAVVEWPLPEASTRTLHRDEIFCSCQSPLKCGTTSKQVMQDDKDVMTSVDFDADQVRGMIVAWEAVNQDETAASVDLNLDAQTVFEPVRRLRTSEPPSKFQRSPKRSVIRSNSQKYLEGI